MNDAPYRAAVPVADPAPKPMFGLLRVPRAHECSTPGSFFRFWMWLTLRGLDPGHTLWRCKECGQTWMWLEPSHSIYKQWIQRSTDVWVESGGAK